MGNPYEASQTPEKNVRMRLPFRALFLGIVLAIAVFSFTGAMLLTLVKFSKGIGFMDPQNLVTGSVVYLTTSAVTLAKMSSIASLLPALTLVFLNARAALDGRRAFFAFAVLSSVLSVALCFLNLGNSRGAINSGILFISGIAASLAIGRWTGRQCRAQMARDTSTTAQASQATQANSDNS